MGYRDITPETSWEQSRAIVRFTASALRAVEEHAHLSVPLTEMLQSWDTLDKSRRAAEDAVVDANAAVTTTDHRLDVLVGKLATRLLFEGDGNRENPAFRKYFPEPPSEVIRMGLATELVRVKKFHLVAQEVKPSKDLADILKQIASVQTDGEQVLTDREQAVATQALVRLKLTTWKEDANAARRSVENMLDAYAVQNGLPRDYSDAFFPKSTRTKKKAVDIE